jgi:aminoglycoside phosphotransferase (APT) family kinase protein
MKPINLSAPIAQGRTADVYPWDADHILKLYQNWCPAEWAEHETRVAQALQRAGVPTPAAKEIVTVEGRRGVIYERVPGISMLDDLRRNPWRIFRHARSLAELQIKIHQQTVADLHSYRAGLAHSIQRAPHLPDSLRQKTLDWLATLPDGTALCHGDFHPANVLISPGGPVVIDWMTASLGSPWADVARTSLILTIGVRSAGKTVPPLMRWLSGLFHHTYLARYHALATGGAVELKRWQPVIAAARLDEQIAPEREALLQEIATFCEKL